MPIQIVGLKKEFNHTQVTNGVNLEIPDHQMTVIIGRSGEGKSVLLKQIIGLLKPDEGSVIVDGVNITNLPEKKKYKGYRKFGYVFQFAALLDSLNVFENIGITLLEQGIPASKVLPIVKEKLALVNLKESVLYKYPSELSGGMKKRVGLARTLVTEPDIILYDEPTTGLDPITSRVIHELMYDMQKKLNVTSIVISHDVEIFKYADNVALLYEGKIDFFGSSKTIWESENPFIYQFIRGLTQGPIQLEKTHAEGEGV
ncbi:MAG TPA: ATP-binding cassette domain-containing protein [Candidatus Limnocylindria bacterium]|nr:ATP-binding cassette domain-containing protein [Candidatus Limnocylindria bacterium]